MLSLLYVPERELNIFLEFGWNFPGKSSKLDAYFEGKKEKNSNTDPVSAKNTLQLKRVLTISYFDHLLRNLIF